MIDKKIKKYIYSPLATLQEAIHDLYYKKTGICLICDKKNRLCGVATMRDIKEMIWKGFDPTSPLSIAMNKNFVAANDQTSEQELKKLSTKRTRYDQGYLEKIPMINKLGKLTGLYVNKQSKNTYRPKSVLITGAAGYVGSILCQKLLERGYGVIALDNLGFGKQSIEDLIDHQEFSLLNGDIRNIDDLIEGIRKADYVIHLAGIVGDPASSVDPVHTMEINHFSTKLLIELCKHYQVSRLVFASSCSVYGASHNVLTEKSKLSPLSLYAKTKVSAEKFLLAETGKYFHPVILRFGTLYGLSKRMRFDLVVNTMAANAYFNKKIIVDGGSQWRPLLHVSDAAEVCIRALEAPLSKISGEIFNVGSNHQNFKIKSIAGIINKLVPGSKIIQKNTVKDPRDYKVSFSKIKRAMNFYTSIPLKKGIEDVLGAFKIGQYTDFSEPKYNNHLTLIRNI